MHKHLTSTLILTILTSSAFSQTTDSPPSLNTKTLYSKTHDLALEVEVAASQTQREKGLMYRNSLGENQGMLFNYTDEAPRRVWMKNTLLALDVLFLSHDGRIVSILENLQPCTHDPCRIYDSGKPATYMLEVNAGYVKKHSIKADDRLETP